MISDLNDVLFGAGDVCHDDGLELAGLTDG